MRSMMNLFETFMDDFCDEKNVEKMSDLDQRAQLEVSTHFFFSHQLLIFSKWRTGFYDSLNSWLVFSY